MRINKITVAVVALVAVCLVSFFAVRQLTKKEQLTNPLIYVDVAASNQNTAGTAAPTTQPQTTEPPTTLTEAPSTTLPIQIDSSDSPFTTFPTGNVTVPSTQVTQVTTKPAPQTTVPQTTKKAAPATTDSYIKEATKTSKGFMDYIYNPDGNFYYTTDDPWQRNFGFNAAYDFGAQFVFMFFDTARIKFDYADKNWMVEFWKGQYGGVFIGAEIGVYYKDPSRKVEHYDCVSDEDALYMEMTLYRNKKEVFAREYRKYWWCTGFVPGKLKKYSDRSELNLKTRITLKNKTMLKAFVEGLETCKEFEFVKGKNFSVDGLDVFINW